MAVSVTTRPSATISGETSRWVAVGNPVVYVLQRKDFEFDQINNNGGFVQLQFNGVNRTSNYRVDDIVYIKSDNSVYAGIGTVTASSFSTNTLVTLNITYTSSATTGYANNDTLYSGWSIDIILKDGSNTVINTDSLRYSPTQAGVITIDVSPILRAQLTPDFNGTLTGTTEIFDDSTIYKEFYISYRIIYGTTEESYTDDSSNHFYAVLGSNQIPAPYGGNLAQYVTFNDGTPAAKFLTELNTVKMWRGYPCLISAIVGDNVSGNVFAGTDNDWTASGNYSEKIITLDLDKIITAQEVDTDTVKLYLDTSPDVQLTETKDIELTDACRNPIYLIGRNKRGGMLCWMFEGSQDYTFDYGNDIKAKRLTLRAENLNINEWEALQDFITLGAVYRNNIVTLTSSIIKTSSRIGQQLYVVDEDGNKTGVIALPTKNTTLTKQNKHVFEIEIEYPETFTV